MVFGMVRSCPWVALVLGGCRPKSAYYCALPRATWHELQRDLQVAATCARLKIALGMPSCEPRLAAVSARPGAS